MARVGPVPCAFVHAPPASVRCTRAAEWMVIGYKMDEHGADASYEPVCGIHLDWAARRACVAPDEGAVTVVVRPTKKAKAAG